MVGLSTKAPPIRLRMPRSRFITWLCSWSSTGAAIVGDGSVIVTAAGRVVDPDRRLTQPVKSTSASTSADRDELHALAGDELRHQVDVLLLVDDHLEARLRGVVLAEVAELGEDRSRAAIDGGGRERVVEQVEADDAGARRGRRRRARRR